MSVFERRFLTNPGSTVLLNIESVNVLDLTPPSAIIGVGSGNACIVGEFENGPFAAPTAILSAGQFLTSFGQLGYQYGGNVSQNPCARARKADGALVNEFWNGNGFVQLNGKTFSALTICRVNTSVGQVSFTRLAFLTGAASFAYALTSGQVLQADTGSGPQSATFTGTAATVSGTAIGTGSLGLSAGATLVLGFDGSPSFPNFTTTFLSTDTTITQVVARINAYAGFTFATISGSGGTSAITLTGLQLGLGGQVRVVSGSSGVLTALGLTAATTVGGGNVQNIAAVTPAEVNTIVSAAVTNSKVEVDQNGALRLSNTGASGFLVIGSGTTATALGFLASTEATAIGAPILVSGSGTYNLGTTGTVTVQIDASLPSVVVTVTSGHSLAQTVTDFNTAFTAAGQGAPVTADGSTRFYVVGPNPGGTISVLSASAGSILTELGLVVGTTVGVLPPMGLLPAGTVVQSTGGTQFVTMQDLDYEATGVSLAGTLLPSAASYAAPIRFALDDGTGVGVAAGSITTVVSPPAIGAFSAVNLQVVSNALTEGQVDAAYLAALAATINPNLQAAQQINIVWSARQSNAVRAGLKNNAIQASQTSGCQGRMAVVRTPLGTPEANALSNTLQPGVGAYRDQRTIYCYPQANTTVPQIAAVGTAGGAGFTASGAVDVGADGFMACILSQLNPEENPGQVTNFTGAVNGLETSPNVQGFGINDYIAFKAAGIAALRMDQGVAIFQSGTTSVGGGPGNPLSSIKRRRMADFIQDSIAISMKEFGKKLATVKRQRAILTEIKTFLNGLAGGGPNAQNGFPNDPDAQRIAAYAVTFGDESLLPEGLFVIVIAVQVIASLDSIVLQTTIGETVNVQEVISPNQSLTAA